jgi:hypothetical protein
VNALAMTTEEFSIMRDVSATTAEGHIKIVRLYAEATGGFTELRSFNDKGRGGGARNYWIPSNASENDLATAVEWASEQSAQGWGTFIGMNPRASRHGGKTSVTQMTSCYVDLDLEKQHITRETAMKRIECAPIAPDLIVESGHGLHLIYFFTPITDKAEWRALQTRISEFYTMVGADMSLRTDEARVLRLAGFPNQKAEPRETRIVQYNPLETPRDFREVAQGFGITSSGQTPLIVGERIGLSEMVAEGWRNRFLFGEACALRDRGYTESEIQGALQPMNEIRCQPPVDDAEVRGVVRSAMRYEPALFHIQQELFPRLLRLAVTVAHGQQFFLTFGRRANYH